MEIKYWISLCSVRLLFIIRIELWYANLLIEFILQSTFRISDSAAAWSFCCKKCLLRMIHFRIDVVISLPYLSKLMLVYIHHFIKERYILQQCLRIIQTFCQSLRSFAATWRALTRIFGRYNILSWKTIELSIWSVLVPAK